MKKLIIAAAIFLSACTTKIHNQDYTIKPAEVRLGTFDSVIVRPLYVEHMGGDRGDRAAVERLDQGVRSCMSSVFGGKQQTSSADNAPANTLLIEPSIVDLKKVGTGERFFAGAFAGSSAVLLKTKYTDLQNRKVIAEPVFYSKASAMGGAWTLGATDNGMLSRATDLACDYARRNF